MYVPTHALWEWGSHAQGYWRHCCNAYGSPPVSRTTDANGSSLLSCCSGVQPCSCGGGSGGWRCCSRTALAMAMSSAALGVM